MNLVLHGPAPLFSSRPRAKGALKKGLVHSLYKSCARSYPSIGRQELVRGQKLIGNEDHQSNLTACKHNLASQQGIILFHRYF